MHETEKCLIHVKITRTNPLYSNTNSTFLIQVIIYFLNCSNRNGIILSLCKSPIVWLKRRELNTRIYFPLTYCNITCHVVSEKLHYEFMRD